MQTLPYGLTKPEDGDRGQPLFDALAENFEHIDSHSHNGTNSPKLSVSAITRVVQNLDSADWVASGIGFEQTVAITGGLSYDDISMEFRDNSDGSKLYLDTEKLTASTFKVFCNDSSLDVDIVYS